VTRQDIIDHAFGGRESSAYMLTYRKKDCNENVDPISPDQFPEHIKVNLIFHFCFLFYLGTFSKN
jgi:hypothetical protein